jgi:hypothetical protein
MAIPTTAKQWYLRSPSWLLICDVAIALAVAVAGFITALRLWDEQQKGLAIAAGAGALVILVFTGIRATLQYRERATRESPHDLLGCLHTLRGMLEASSEEPGLETGLRITVWVPVDSGNQLEQACDYACADHSRCKGTATRRMAATVGVIGRAYQTGKYAIAKRVSDDPEAHVEDLIQNWGFSSDRARRVDPTVRAWMAVPLTTPERGVEAIVYVDARKREFFTENRQLLVLGGCGGLALFVRQRYNWGWFEMKSASKQKQSSTSRDSETTSTMRVELREIPREFQRSIEQNLRISRAAADSQRTSKK